MAGEMQVLASLNRLLESRETREQTRMQNALAMMQFAQQKKMADYQLASSQLGVLQQANQVVQAKQAQRLITDLGLDRFDVTTDQGVTDAQDKLMEWDWGDGPNLDKQDANQLISAYQAYKSGNYAGILGLASSMKDIIDKTDSDPNYKTSAGENKLINIFDSLGHLDDRESAVKKLKAIQLSVDNDDKILEEQFELAQGDTEIDEELSAYSTDELADAAEEMDTAEEALAVETPEIEKQKLDESIKKLEMQLEEKNIDLEILAERVKTLDSYKQSDHLSDEQQEFYDDIPKMREEIEESINALSDKIEKEKQVSKILSTKFAVEEEPTDYLGTSLKVAQFAPVPGARQIYGLASRIYNARKK